MKKRKGIIFTTAILFLLVAAAIAVLLKGCGGKADSLETVRIGAARSPITGLVFIADERGFFARCGINVVMKAYDSGPLALNALLSEAVDVATAADFVMVQKSFDNQDLRAFAQIANTNATELVARRDRGIEKLSDLKGKRVGLPRGSSSEFLLGTYLSHNNMPFSSVEMVDLAPLATEEALYKCAVDAVVIWEPHVTRIKERLGKNSVSWAVQGRDDYYFLLVTKEELLRRLPAVIEKMLRAVIDAEDFAGKHPEEAQRIIDARINFRPDDAQLFLAKSTLKVRLDQDLLTLMEAQAHWMIRNNLTSERQMPNYLDMISLKAMEVVKPEAVGIIH